MKHPLLLLYNTAVVHYNCCYYLQRFIMAWSKLLINHASPEGIQVPRVLFLTSYINKTHPNSSQPHDTHTAQPIIFLLLYFHLFISSSMLFLLLLRVESTWDAGWKWNAWLTCAQSWSLTCRTQAAWMRSFHRLPVLSAWGNCPLLLQHGCIMMVEKRLISTWVIEASSPAVLGLFFLIAHASTIFFFSLPLSLSFLFHTLNK